MDMSRISYRIVVCHVQISCLACLKRLECLYDMYFSISPGRVSFEGVRLEMWRYSDAKLQRDHPNYGRELKRNLHTLGLPRRPVRKTAKSDKSRFVKI